MGKKASQSDSDAVGSGYMKKISSLSIAFVAVVGLGLASTTPLQARTVMEQHQSNESKIEMECSGDCFAKSKSSMSQSQKMSFGDDHGGRNRNESDDRGHIRRFRWSHDNSDGEVRLSWNQRGGTCTVRYTEASARNYNYTTSAACDDGSMTIGGLVPGRAYRFQVKKDNENWSKAIRLVAN